MDTTMPTTPATPALSRTKAWLVGGSLAGVALGSLATALALRGPAPGPTSGPDAEPRETIVSSKSPAMRTAAAPARTAVSTTPSPNTPATPAAAATPATRTTCSDCAVVQSVTTIERKGEATGLGAVGGAVAGGLLGSQAGGGSGKDAMTILGAVGGGVAGHHMEQKLRSSTEYRVRVKMADGSTRTLSHGSRLAPGAAVRVEGDRLVALAPAQPATAARATPPAPPVRTAQGTEAERPRSLADAKRL